MTSIAAIVLTALLTVAIPSPQAPISTDIGAEPLVSAGWIAEIEDELYVDGGVVSEVALTLDTYSGETPGYDRTGKFGAAWNVKIDGCDTRNRILQRDFVSFDTGKPGDDCTVTTGVLDDPYSGEVIDFQRTNYPNTGDGDSGTIQIDHIIPLKAAWNGGADLWTQDEREAFANDPMNLWASKGALNGSKGDKLYGEWQPPAPDFQCIYIAKQVWLLDTYDIAVLQSDKDALVTGAAQCALPAGAPAPAEPEPSETTTATPSADNDVSFFDNIEWGYVLAVGFILIVVGSFTAMAVRSKK